MTIVWMLRLRPEPEPDPEPPLPPLRFAEAWREREGEGRRLGAQRLHHRTEMLSVRVRARGGCRERKGGGG